MPEITRLLPENLKFARQLKGMSKVELASETGVSKQSVTNWEKGTRSPDFLNIRRLASVLSVPYTFLIGTSKFNQSDSKMVLFRSKVAVPKKNKLSYERRADVYASFVNVMSTFVSYPQFLLSNIELNYSSFRIISDYVIEKKANDIRHLFKLSNGPIENVTALLERSGISVVFISDQHAGIDAVSKKYKNGYVILLNVFNQSAARVRFSLAHELGHIILHSGYSRNVYETQTIHKRLEEEANYFASCLLMPQDGFLMDIISPTLKGLINVKWHWKLSIQAMAMRLEQLDIIDDSKKVQIFIELSRRYSRAKEPYDFGDNSIPMEKPTLANSAIEFLQNNHVNYESMLDRNGLSVLFLESNFPYLIFNRTKKVVSPNFHIL
ncbi:hypothetical protein [Lactobacillus plantarum subsp. plantarum] [Lactiplantibacillus mudanjiangensis]|uniref:helix-turn-helix domain-containing protein n=1 Tax=Lactiplantibacillus mudanjiangensis TaxID=1296538 RepID=UPI00101461EB|nr:hypothetical protein [Lactobacillus plantarum subsp. plantarum] [Lactiplantibacillus mudanjiangensis]